MPNNKNLIIFKKRDDYHLINKHTKEILFEFINKPKTIYFKIKNKKYSSFIFHDSKIRQIVKKYNLKNVRCKIRNKSYSLNSHIKSFLDDSSAKEIYENYDIPGISEKKFKKIFYKVCLKEPAPKINKPFLSDNFTLTQLDLYDYFYNPKDSKNTKINYIYPRAGNYNYKDYVDLSRFIFYMGSDENILSPSQKMNYSSSVLYTAGSRGIGKTLLILHDTKKRGIKLYFNMDILDNNFQNTINLFFKEALFAFYDDIYNKYLLFQKNIKKDICDIENNIFCLLSLFIKYYDTNIFINGKIYLIIDNYKISQDTNKYLDKLIEEIKYNTKYRMIVNYSLNDIENKKIILSKLLNNEKNFLYLNDLGANYKDLVFADKRIKEVLVKFNYLPYYYFNNIKLFEDETKTSEQITENIEDNLMKEFLKIGKIGYFLSLIPCIHLLKDNNILIQILSKFPLEYFKLTVEKTKSFGNNKISIVPLNDIIKKISDGLIEESLSNLIINEFDEIINNQIIQGIAYEIYLTKKIINKKKFGSHEFEVKCVQNISQFNYSENLDENKNYMFYQTNFYGQTYDLLFLINKRAIFAQISISKLLKDLKSVINSFCSEEKIIIKKIKSLNYQIDNSELFFIFSPNSPSIKTCKKYNLPFIIYDSKEDKIFLQNNENEINEFPDIFNSKSLFIKNINLIFNTFQLTNKKIDINNYIDNRETIYKSKSYIFKITKIIKLENYNIKINSLKSTRCVAFISNDYLIIPIKDENNITIYNIKENNELKLIKNEEKKSEILSTIFNIIIFGRIIKIYNRQSNSEGKLLQHKRKRSPTKSKNKKK